MCQVSFTSLINEEPSKMLQLDQRRIQTTTTHIWDARNAKKMDLQKDTKWSNRQEIINCNPLTQLISISMG